MVLWLCNAIAEGAMTEDEKSMVRQTARFPRSLWRAIEEARGEPGKPRASFNDTLLYLVREGLKATGRPVPTEAEPGNWTPALCFAR
jgi:hypothetical protein